MTASFKIPLKNHIDLLSAKGKGALVNMLDMIYPPQCLTCREPVQKGASLCAGCWSDTQFISGAICNHCGAPVIGEMLEETRCDGCITYPPAWDSGRAALVYDGGGRRLAMAFKHGDRLDMARPLAEWMARAGSELLEQAEVIVPVPLYWRRLLKRKFNQSGELARHLGQISGKEYAPDLLVRVKNTQSQDGLNRAERFENQCEVFVKRKKVDIPDRVLLVDDVMTSGATLSACAEVLRGAGVSQIDVLVLVRVALYE